MNTTQVLYVYPSLQDNVMRRQHNPFLWGAGFTTLLGLGLCMRHV